MFPPIPTWSGFHPLVIHFPIGLLLIAPVLVLMGLILPKHRLVYSSAALTLMIVGTITIFIAMASGEAAEEAADLPDGIEQVLTQHEQLASMSRNIFTILTIIYSGFLITAKLREIPIKHTTFATLSMVFLLAYSAGTLVLANAAHAGGRLVHQFGIKSVLPETEPGKATASVVDLHEKPSHDD